MPNYGTLPTTGTGSGVGATTLASGDNMTLFNAESPTAPQASIAVSPGDIVPGETGLVFTATWATTPTASLQIQASNVDTDATYQSVGAPITTSPGYYADIGNFRFYRARLASQSAGGAVTCIVQRQF